MKGKTRICPERGDLVVDKGNFSNPFGKDSKDPKNNRRKRLPSKKRAFSRPAKKRLHGPQERRLGVRGKKGRNS